MDETTLARGLGWFSIGLGAAELLAPRWLGRQIGVGHHPHLMRAYGLREVASGIGALTERHPTHSLWSRVVGDALDLATLGLATRRPGKSQRSRTRLATAIGMVAAVAAVDFLVARRLQQST